MDISDVERGTAPIFNRRVSSVVQGITMKELLKGGDWNPNLRNEFLSLYSDWIKSSSSSPVLGLEQFPTNYYTNGVTQTYDIFFSEYKGRRFRTLKGEYPYVRLSVDSWAHVEDDELRENDALVLSQPFYGNGGVPRNYTALLDRCAELGIPVMVDAAYFGTCFGVTFDYSHPAIETVGFSLSKSFSVQSFRIGLMFTKKKLGYLEEIQVQASYYNRMGAYVGLTLMQNFEADYMPNAYRDSHRAVCARLDLLPTHCLMLGNVRNDDRRFDRILKDDRFEDVELPDGAYRRVCISPYLSDHGSTVKRVAKMILSRA